ncbi:ECF transporter S component [Mycoplasmatota bacterium]|nr:ECF transporter S component [Mycoplasmatota bacterium]
MYKTKKLVTLAILASLGTVLMYFEIPLTNVFKVDASDLTVIISTVIYGPIGGIIVAFLKSLLHFLVKRGETGVGLEEIIAFTASMVYVLPFYFSMKYSKKIFNNNKILIRLIPTIVATIAMIVILPTLNYLIFFKLYFIYTNIPYTHNLIYTGAVATIIPNIIKGVFLSTAFIILSFRLEQIVLKLDVSDNHFKNLLSED